MVALESLRDNNLPVSLWLGDIPFLSFVFSSLSHLMFIKKTFISIWFSRCTHEHTCINILVILLINFLHKYLTDPNGFGFLLSPILSLEIIFWFNENYTSVVWNFLTSDSFDLLELWTSQTSNNPSLSIKFYEKKMNK